ncbi:M13 family metallopeptidase [Ferruginibacter sp. HRS2-29]|uniref:M13 family metallopeptidase n=1 Tax=Ferruginibacter sp. HRS2-29 TaxID=2487334 RepID=UPI0020CF1627|nr:M13 family metallopeptidase [Ferruginibacter sp. HRS2-29]MCP9749866.1 M13 family peptidase [Ferruginibacter sp. HRS2-29]
MKKLAFYAISCCLLASCNNADKGKDGSKPDILAANLDSTVSPGEDFFQYANGGWIKRTPIPGAESGWGIGNMVQDEIYERLKKINEDAAKEKAAAGSISQKIGDYWKSGMDSAAIEKAGLSPLQADLKAIDAISNTDQLIATAANLHKKSVGGFFGTYVGQDDKNSEVMAFFVSQGGLGLPNRDYYFDTDERTLKIKAAYREYMAKTFRQLDTATAAKNAEAVFALETKLAKASRKLADLRDPYKNYNKMSWLQLAAIAPDINWNEYTKISGANKVDSVIVGQPEFLKTLSAEVKSTPIDTWKSYLKLRLIQASAPYLDHVTFNNNFEYRKSLTGATEPRPRWKRVLDAEEDAMGEALGQLFVKEYFGETAKKRYNDIVENVRAAYKERIAKLSWMSDSTKQKAFEKLAKITKKVGYPDKWKDFSALKIDDGPWILNVQRGAEWWHNYEINKLGKPVDRSEWGMNPQEYNAYYNPSNNEIVMPAGIFAVPGYRDEDLDDAVVYGYAAASTIGHEITHGFDDQGRQYDAAGNLKNWWTKTDEDEFSKRASMIIKQFNEFVPVDTLHINGDATQGENIADLGGMLIGLDAFKKTAAYKKNEKIAGLTQLQRYFMGYALGWLYTVKKERLANLVKTDVHSPAKERVNGPVVNIPEFYEAFGIKKGDKMYRPDSLRVNIW